MKVLWWLSRLSVFNWLQRGVRFQSRPLDLFEPSTLEGFAIVAPVSWRIFIGEASPDCARNQLVRAWRANKPRHRAITPRKRVTA